MSKDPAMIDEGEQVDVTDSDLTTNLVSLELTSLDQSAYGRRGYVQELGGFFDGSELGLGVVSCWAHG
jgi:hypothetical protein